MRKLIIYDPICMTSSGHNARLCRLFYEKCIRSGINAKVLTATNMQFDSIPELEGLPQEGWLTCCYDLLGTDAGKHIDLDKLFSIAEDDLRKTLIKSPEWRIFVPGCDYYTFNAVCRISETDPDLIRGRVMLRFISVLENDTRRDHNKGRFFTNLSKYAARLADVGVRLSAETIFYADFLRKVAKTHVEVCPYPIHFDKNNAPPVRDAEGELKIGVIGAPRREKGYFRLASLAKAMQSNDRAASLFVQRMRLSSPEFLANYDMYLHGQPNVISVKGYLDDTEMNRALATCDYQLLFYESSIYRYRGSAILFDAAQQFCPVLALRDNAYSKEVEKFGIGYVFDTQEELVDLLAKIPKRAPDMDEKLVAFQEWADLQTSSCIAV